jgi:threonine dehydrogenase-like Zn-dependent dehydrogenase
MKTSAPMKMNCASAYVRMGGTVLLFGMLPSGKNLEMEGFKIFQKGLTVLSSFTSVRNSFRQGTCCNPGKFGWTH